MAAATYQKQPLQRKAGELAWMEGTEGRIIG
jgi:hypothetical protein